MAAGKPRNAPEECYEYLKVGICRHGVLAATVQDISGGERIGRVTSLARSERFELPTLGIEIRCSIQLSYERVRGVDYQTWPGRASGG
jgi:hypothetical protein